MTIPLPLFELLEAAAFGVSGTAAVRGLVDAVLGLRAKRRARNALSAKIKSDPALRKLAQTLDQGALPARELDEANKVILRAITDLSGADQKRVAEGLKQASRQAERRYIDNLLESA